MWSYEQVLAELMRTIREIASHADFSPDTSLGAIANFDSLDSIEFVMHIEETFECDLESAFGNDTTVAELARIIWEKLR